MTFKEVIAYLKDNPNGYWFKRKLYGWGWVPVQWQGWAVILVFIAFLIGCSVFLGENPTNDQLTWFFGAVIFGVIGIIFICYKKGEPPAWQWGIPKKHKIK